MKKPAVVVGDLMSTGVISMRETDPLSRAIREMTMASVRHLPIVADDGRLTGLVSSHDLVAAVEREGDPPLRELMTREIVSVRPTTPALDAIGLMIDQKFNALPVVDAKGDLVGILTATDVLVLAYQALSGAPIERLPGEI